MNLLRETIRRLILEDACATLNDKVTQGIETLQTQGLGVFFEKSSDYIEVLVRNAGGAGSGRTRSREEIEMRDTEVTRI